MSLIVDFLIALKDYLIEITPALAIGFFLSGLIHEFLPADWIEKNLGRKGIRGILYATLVGSIMPVCCWDFSSVFPDTRAHVVSLIRTRKGDNLSCTSETNCDK